LWGARARVMARAVPIIPAPTIKASDSWWRLRRSVVGEGSRNVKDFWDVVGEGGVEREVAGVWDGGGESQT